MYGSELPNEKSQLCVVSIGSSEGGRVDFKHSRASFQRNWPNFHSWLMVAHRDTLENDQGWDVMFTMSVAAQLCIQTNVHTDRCLESRHVLFGDVSASEDVDCWSNKVGFCCSNLISETKPARVLLSHVSSCSRSRLTLLTLLGGRFCALWLVDVLFQLVGVAASHCASVYILCENLSGVIRICELERRAEMGG